MCFHTIFVEYNYPITAVWVDQVGGGDAIVGVVPNESRIIQHRSQPSVAIDFGRLFEAKITHWNLGGLVQDCSSSSALAMDLLDTKPST